MELQETLRHFFRKLWRFRHFLPYVLFILYALVGSGILFGIDRGFRDYLDIDEPMVNNGTKCLGNNDYWAAMFYVLSLCTTIGFGNIYACFALTKTLSLLYSIFAIPLFLFILFDLSHHFSNALAQLHTRHMSHWIKRLRASSTEEATQAMLDKEPPDPHSKPQATGNGLAWAEEDLEDEEMETENANTGDAVRSVGSGESVKANSGSSIQKPSFVDVTPAPIWFPLVLLGAHLFLMTLYVFATEPGTYWTAIYRTLLTFLAADYHTQNFHLAIPTFLFIFIGLILLACLITIVYRQAVVHIERTKSCIRSDARDKIFLLETSEDHRLSDFHKEETASIGKTSDRGDDSNVEASVPPLENLCVLDDLSMVEQIVHQQIPSKVWRTALQWKMDHFVDCYQNESAKAIQTQESLVKRKTSTQDAFVEPATPIQRLDFQLQCVPLMKDFTSETLVSTTSSAGVQCSTENQTSSTSPRQVLLTSLAIQCVETPPLCSQQMSQTDPLKELARKTSQSTACQHPDPPPEISSSSMQTSAVESTSAEIQTEVLPGTPKKVVVKPDGAPPAGQAKKQAAPETANPKSSPNVPAAKSTSKPEKRDSLAGQKGQKGKASPRPSPSTSKHEDLAGSAGPLRTASPSPARPASATAGSKRGKSPTTAGTTRGGKSGTASPRGRGQTPPSRGKK